MNEPEEPGLNRIEAFNHLIDRAVQGCSVFEDGFSPEDQYALNIADRLSRLDFSECNAIRTSLRTQLVMNVRQYPARASDRFRVRLVRDGRMMAGICFTLMLVFGCVFAFLAPLLSHTGQQDFPLAAQVLLGNPEFSYTLTVQQHNHIFPRPMPTPIPLSAYQQDHTVQPLTTPACMGISTGEQPLIITLTRSK